MSKSIADGSNEVVRRAAADAYDIQDASNMRGVLNTMLDHLRLLGPMMGSDELHSHPVTVAFIDKLVSLSRHNYDHALDALSACRRLKAGESVEYEVRP